MANEYYKPESRSRFADFTEMLDSISSYGQAIDAPRAKQMDQLIRQIELTTTQISSTQTLDQMNAVQNNINSMKAISEKYPQLGPLLETIDNTISNRKSNYSYYNKMINSEELDGYLNKYDDFIDPTKYAEVSKAILDGTGQWTVPELTKMKHDISLYKAQFDVGETQGFLTNEGSHKKNKLALFAGNIDAAIMANLTGRIVLEEELPSIWYGDIEQVENLAKTRISAYDASMKSNRIAISGIDRAIKTLKTKLATPGDPSYRSVAKLIAAGEFDIVEDSWGELYDAYQGTTYTTEEYNIAKTNNFTPTFMQDENNPNQWIMSDTKEDYIAKAKTHLGEMDLSSLLAEFEGQKTYRQQYDKTLKIGRAQWGGGMGINPLDLSGVDYNNKNQSYLHNPIANMNFADLENQIINPNENPDGFSQLINFDYNNLYKYNADKGELDLNTDYMQLGGQTNDGVQLLKINNEYIKIEDMGKYMDDTDFSYIGKLSPTKNAINNIFGTPLGNAEDDVGGFFQQGFTRNDLRVMRLWKQGLLPSILGEIHSANEFKLLNKDEQDKIQRSQITPNNQRDNSAIYQDILFQRELIEIVSQKDFSTVLKKGLESENLNDKRFYELLEALYKKYNENVKGTDRYMSDFLDDNKIKDYMFQEINKNSSVMKLLNAKHQKKQE